MFIGVGQHSTQSRQSTPNQAGTAECTSQQRPRPSMKRLRMIMQRRSTECGAACVAMLTGTSLTAARAAIEFNNDGDYRTYPSGLRRVLCTAGIRLGRKVECSSWDGLRKRSVRAIAAVRHHVTPSGLDRWHWILFDSTGDVPRAFDPERGIRTDFGRIRLSWYHLLIEAGANSSAKPASRSD